VPREVKKEGVRWRLWGGLTLLAIGCVTSAIAGKTVRDFALTDDQFRLSTGRPGALTVEGMRFTSRGKIQRVFASDFGRSVFAIPVAERRRRLLAIDWVESASVSRVWPDRVMVRIRERTPIAFVSLRSSVALIDIYGVLLDVPPQSHFSFPVLNGISDETSEAARRDQVDAFLHLQQDLGSLAKDVSEVNVADLDNLRMIVHVDHQAIELVLGRTDFGARYQNFLNHLPDIRRGSPGVTMFDLRLRNRITAKAKD